MAWNAANPALLIRISRRPKCCAASFTTRLMSSCLKTSRRQFRAFPPPEFISSSTRARPLSLISVNPTRAPSEANRCAVARPIPLAAPVTSTALPFTERSSFRIGSIQQLLLNHGSELFWLAERDHLALSLALSLTSTISVLRHRYHEAADR